MKSLLARRWLLSFTTLTLVLALGLAWWLLSNALRPVGLYTGWLLLGLVLCLSGISSERMWSVQLQTQSDTQQR